MLDVVTTETRDWATVFLGFDLTDEQFRQQEFEDSMESLEDHPELIGDNDDGSM